MADNAHWFVNTIAQIFHYHITEKKKIHFSIYCKKLLYLYVYNYKKMRSFFAN